MRKLILNNSETVLLELKQIGVDPRAYPLFMDKTNYVNLKFEGLTCAQANILKQTALICGADVALPKTIYHGHGKKKIPAILFANIREIHKIKSRLANQPLMDNIAEELAHVLAEKQIPILRIRRKAIKFDRTYIMGVINITPDSFYGGSRYNTQETAKRIAQEMEKEGADFIDIGAESSRPGAKPVSNKEEIARLKKILPAVIKNTSIPISIDTYKSEVATFAIDHGVKIINDISGLNLDKKMVNIVARNKACLVIMHIKGTPKTMQIKPHYDDVMCEIYGYLKRKIDIALQKGIDVDRIIIDPGLGFGKRLKDNYEIINRLNELSVFNRPIMVGHSRKSFIGKPFDIDPEQRLEGSLAVEAILIKNGASIIRVHDVLEAKRVAQLIDIIKL